MEVSKFTYELANKGNYGIDAPPVVRNLSLIGILLIIAAGIVFSINGIVWRILSILFLLGGIVCFAEVIMMVWSSKKGKRHVVKKLMEQLRVKESDTVLDVGCGRGFVLHSLAKQLSSGKAIGIDIWNTSDQSGNSPEITLQNAETEGVKDRVDVIDADARALPFEPNTFDAIASSLAIHNIADRKERQKAINEIVRVLKTNGRVAILDFQYVAEYAQMLEKAGLTDVKISKMYFAMFPPVRIVSGIKK